MMDSLHSLYLQHSFGMWLGLVAVVLLVALWVLVVQLRSRRLARRIDELFDGLSNENAASMLTEYLRTARYAASSASEVKAQHDELAALMPTVIRHVGLVRFSPFHDTGGDQSFALALLDGKGDGVVLTALHSRTDSRLYAKPIDRGDSAYVLIPEEREAMDRARRGVPVETRV